MHDETDPRLILLSPHDDCLIAAARLPAGETLMIEGEPATLTTPVELAHKLARRALSTDEKVLRYGAIIGHVTSDVPRRASAHAQPRKRLHPHFHARCRAVLRAALEK